MSNFTLHVWFILIYMVSVCPLVHIIIPGAFHHVWVPNVSQNLLFHFYKDIHLNQWCSAFLTPRPSNVHHNNIQTQRPITFSKTPWVFFSFLSLHSTKIQYTFLIWIKMSKQVFAFSALKMAGAGLWWDWCSQTGTDFLFL